MTNRNSNAHFELSPHVSIERSTFDRSFNVKTSFDVGELVPFMAPEEVLPGDTFEINTSKVARLQTLITPVMDNLYLDTYYFFVPNRLVWDHWKEFCGENTDSAWKSDITYEIPQIKFPEDTGYEVGTIADYMGLPLGVPYMDEEFDGYTVNALPFRAYALIVNEWFRDENLQKPAHIYKGDNTVQGINAGTTSPEYINGLELGAKPFIAGKYHDYYTSALPQPQKGAAVELLPDIASAYAPVITRTVNGNDSATPLRMLRTDGTSISTIAGLGVNDASGQVKQVAPSSQSLVTSGVTFKPANLWTEIPGYSNSLNVNDVRQAFAIQRMLERDAISGSRYIEVIRAHFSIESPDARLQRPEYLGGNRVPLNVEQVVQTSSTNSTSPLGSLAGMSQTADLSHDVVKSFTEHGYIIGLMCVRYDHTYQNFIEKMWTRRSRYEFYWPALAHLGEQAVKKREIFIKNSQEPEVYSAQWNDTFGYQEAWAEYRYKPNYITGLMRSTQFLPQEDHESLDMWHFADNYSEQPTLSAEWIQEDKTNVDRALAVTSDVANQVFIDIMVNEKVTRPMPLYSIPGLIDHF